jgi:hypothetical protein
MILKTRSISYLICLLMCSRFKEKKHMVMKPPIHHSRHWYYLVTAYNPRNRPYRKDVRKTISNNNIIQHIRISRREPFGLCQEGVPLAFYLTNSVEQLRKHYGQIIKNCKKAAKRIYIYNLNARQMQRKALPKVRKHVSTSMANVKLLCAYDG